jgi:GNAT superfamily N-acetyltransferase
MTDHIRLATVADIPTINHQRRAMFAEMGWDHFLSAGMDKAFAEWLRPRLENGTYLGWFAVTAAGEIAGGVGLWIREGTPHPHDFSTRRGYVMNVYIEPEQRRQGLARDLMQTLLDWCRANALYSVNLHASDAGQPLYESLGFTPANEMSIFLG